jgi:hypothetical protein
MGLQQAVFGLAKRNESMWASRQTNVLAVVKIGSSRAIGFDEEHTLLPNVISGL